MIAHFSDAISQIVKWVINLAPIGIMGLVYDAISTSGLSALLDYGKLLLVLLGCMLFVALVMNPLIAFVSFRKNPYPLVLRTFKRKWSYCILYS